LRLCIGHISVRVLAQGFGAALDGICFKVNIICQTGHQRRQTGKGIVILGIPGSIAVCGSFDGLQLADVLVGNAGGSFHVGECGIVVVASFLHAVAHLSRRTGQFLNRRNGIVRRCSKRSNESDRSSNRHRCKRQRPSKASQRACEQRCRCMSQLDASSHSGQRSNQAAKRDRSGGNALDHAGVFLNEALHPAQNFSPDIVQLGQSRGQILADGDF